MTIEELISEQKPENPQKQEMLELWNRLEKSEKEIVIGVMKAILFHNK
jgi:hypothetical protein